MVYDIERSVGDDGKGHEVKPDAGNGKDSTRNLKRKPTSQTGEAILKPLMMGQAIPKTPIEEALWANDRAAARA